MLDINEKVSKKEYIDMHCHIIPHVDDGAGNTKQAFNMIEIAYENGIRTIIATPHYEVGRFDSNRENIDKYYKKMKSMIEENMPDFKLYLGNEIFFSYGIVDRLNEGEIYTLADSDYVLIEFSPNDRFSYIEKGLYEVLNAGYTPILAHVERYEEVMKSPVKNVKKLVDRGVLIQVNASTIAGHRGSWLRRKIMVLIKNDLVHFISTDAHSDGRRSPDLKDCLKYLRKKVDRKTINRLLRKNALKVIENEDIL